jgi:hypothetical protein
LQEWSVLEDPYDEVLLPKDENVKSRLPNKSCYCFVSGGQGTISSIVNNFDPKNAELETRVTNCLEVCNRINRGFTALGLSRILPSWLHFVLRKRIHSLHNSASMTVRDVQYAALNLGYTQERLLQEECLPALPGFEPDPTIRLSRRFSRHFTLDLCLFGRSRSLV